MNALSPGTASSIPGPAFHGFVADKNGSPRADLHVKLVGTDASGQRIELPGRYDATTEYDGYFVVPPPALEGADRQKARTAAAAIVVITDKQGVVVCEDSVPLQLELGTAYREYRLGDLSKVSV